MNVPTLTSPILAPVIGAPKEGPSVAGWHKAMTFLRCPQEYKFAEILGIKHKDKEDKMALQVGTLTHIGRAEWFASQFSKDPKQCSAAITKHIQTTGTPYRVDAEREAIRLVEAYVEHWRSKPLPLCRAVEYELGPAPLKEDDPFYAYRTARLDDLSIYPDADNKLCIGDLKTTSDSIAGCVNEYLQNGQFILYNILYKMAKEGQAVFGPIHGIMLDIETKEAVPKFHREFITISAFQEQWFYWSMKGWLNAMSQVTNETPVPRNVTQCSRAVGRKGSFRCDFHDLCRHGGSRATLYRDREGNVPSKELVEL